MKNCAKFIFMTGDIVIAKKKFKNFNKVEIINNNITIEPSQKGPVVHIYNNKGIDSVHTIPNTLEFMETDPQGVYSKYLSLIKKSLK